MTILTVSYGYTGSLKQINTIRKKLLDVNEKTNQQAVLLDLNNSFGNLLSLVESIDSILYTVFIPYTFSLYVTGLIFLVMAPENIVHEKE